MSISGNVFDYPRKNPYLSGSRISGETFRVQLGYELLQPPSKYGNTCAKLGILCNIFNLKILERLELIAKTVEGNHCGSRKLAKTG